MGHEFGRGGGDGGDKGSGDGTRGAAVSFEGYDTTQSTHGDAQSQELVKSGTLPPADDYLLLLQQAQALVDKSVAANPVTDSAPSDGTGESGGRSSSTDLYGKENVIAQAERNLGTNEGFSLPISGIDIANHAKALGELHRDWWRNEGPNQEIRKCNLYADRVYRDMHAPLPWDSAHIPTVHGMKQQLAQSPEWETIYKSGDDFSKCQANPGDWATWDKTIHTTKDGRPYSYPLEHCGVIGNDGTLQYAGSWIENGYAESDFKQFCASKSNGPPSAIFRLKHLKF